MLVTASSGAVCDRISHNDCMKRFLGYVFAILIVLALHTAATFTVGFYKNLVLDAGGLFVYTTDISGLIDRLEYGFSLVGAVLVLATIAIVYLRGRCQSKAAPASREQQPRLQ